VNASNRSPVGMMIEDVTAFAALAGAF